MSFEVRTHPTGGAFHSPDLVPTPSSFISSYDQEVMAKEVRLDWNPWTLHKHSHIFVRFLAAILLIGLSFRLYFSKSIGFLPVSEPPTVAVEPEFPVGAGNNGGGPQKDKCDLFTGEWIQNPSGPLYNNESCPIIEDHQNCMKNGRPDSSYLNWRWKPRDCELPLFDAKRFLDAMRNKSWALIGDSISRNHVQSLVCLLSKAEEAFEVYHDKEYKSKRWHFMSYNFTLSVIWSPFLVKADIFENNNGVSTSEIQLHLDTLDKKWADEYQNFDYIITSGGQWFLKTAIYWENNTVVGCHYCPGKKVTELGFEYAYRKTLQMVFRLLTSRYKGAVLFRTWTPDHFENGQWFSGGTCSRTVPFKEGEISMSDVVRMMRSIELEEFEKATSEDVSVLKLLDTTYLSLLRPDGHPGPYRHLHPFSKDGNASVQNDCLHWCLPGAIDSWNDLVMELVLNP